MSNDTVRQVDSASQGLLSESAPGFGQGPGPADMDETAAHQPLVDQRLNPFAFPAETNVRFNLLIFALVTLSVDLTDRLYTILTGNDSLVARLNSARDLLMSLAWTALIVIVILGAAYVLYRSHPRSLQRARRLRSFPVGKDAKFTAEVKALAALAGVSPVPSIVVGEKSPPADGQVFGFKERYSVRLGARMPLVMRKAPVMFRGTVLHEMAHIVNGDVGRAYFSQALWGAVVTLLLLPAGLVLFALYALRLASGVLDLLTGSGHDLVRLLTINTPTFIWSIAQFIGLTALIGAFRGSLLRAREVYADWRAALWGAGDGLEAIFRENQGQRRPSTWSRLWRLHPTPQTRLRLLENPRTLFGISDDLPLLVGVLVGASTPGFFGLSAILATTVMPASSSALDFMSQVGGLLYLLSRLIVPVLALTISISAVCAAIFVLTYLTAGSLGLQVQRDGVAALAMNEQRGPGSYLRLGIPAAIYAVGLQIGFLLTPSIYFAPIILLLNYQGDVASLLSIPFGTLAWVMLTTFVIWLWLSWGRFTARRWMARQTGPKPPDRRRRFLTIYMALILLLALIPIIVAQLAIWNPVTHVGNNIPEILPVLFIAGGLALAAITAVVGWLLVVMISSGPITCPACGRRTNHRWAVGQSCEHCGADLAPWIIVQTGAT